MTLYKIIAIALLFTSPLIQAIEETPLPKELPPYATDKPLPIPSIAQRKLPNGLNVWLVKRSSGLPKVDVMLAVHGGSAADAKGMQGASSLLASTLTEGTKTHTAQQLAEALQALGGELSTNVDNDAIYLSGSALRSNAEALLALTADVALHASFPTQEVELAKANTLQALEAEEADPNFQANRAFSAAIFGAHPYHVTTITPDVVKAITPATLIQMHQQRFRPDQALLVIAGNLDNEKMFRIATQVFGDWKAEGKPIAVTPTVPKATARQLWVIDRPGSVQSTLRLGQPTVAAINGDAIPLQVTNVLLGGSFGSRITKNIREDKGYTYTPRSIAAHQEAGGNISINADVRSEVTGASLNEIRYELDRIGTTPVSDKELTETKRYVAGIYLYRNQLQDALVKTLAKNWIVGLPVQYLGEFVPKVNAVTPEQVRDVARKYLSSKDQTIVVVGDNAKIAQDLAQFGNFETPKL